jgi:serine/threonine-protein kinase HipA
MSYDSAMEVWLDSDLAPAMRVGTLAHSRGQIRFHYNPQWLADPKAISLDPDLSLDSAPFFPRPELGNFGVFLDSSPDRWGQTLMKRREALLAKDEQRTPRTLYAWDYLLGVQDITRQGALRFCKPGTEVFLNSEPLAAPPVTTLHELETVAWQLSNRRLDDLKALRKWLAVLVAPGASLGGARPKANFTQTDGSLWIAKFPAREDDRDMGAWEYLAHTLAVMAGIDTPKAKLLNFGGDFHTFVVQRFDRENGQRRFYASAMTLLRKEQSEGTSYTELAEFLRSRGDGRYVDSDLKQLFRRVVFNIAIGNRDDHLRNHGFLLDEGGWRLSPEFDLNPDINKADHVLNIDATDNTPSIANALSTSPYYGLSNQEAQVIAQEVLMVVADWRQWAQKQGLSKGDIELTASAFAAVA